MSVEDYRRQEKEWASHLYGLSLVSEASIDLTDSIDALRFICRSYNAQSNFREDRIRVLRRYPASLLAGLTAVASSRYDEGTFWPKVQEESGITITQSHQSEFSEAFRYGLDRFGLSRFDTPLRNIGEILMHAGIPIPSMESFLRLLAERDARRADLTGEDFCSWVGSMLREVASSRGLDAPTWRFLKEGGAVSADLTERLLVYLDAAARNRQDLCDEALSELPKHLRLEVRRLFDSGQIQRRANRTRGRRHDHIPTVFYHDRSVQVALPSLESEIPGDQIWRFTTAGQSWSRLVGSSWSHSRSIAAWEPISSPIAEIILSYPLLNRSWKLPLVDRDMPLLAFDYSTGKYLPSTHQLPQSWVWLAFPCDDHSSPHDALLVEGELKILEIADTPTGWPGWIFLSADVSKVRKLRSKSGSERWRLISSTKRPTLRTSSEVPFTRTQSGAPIFRCRPKLDLPPSPADLADTARTEWHIHTLDEFDEVVASISVQVGPDGDQIDPWSGLEGALLGNYEIRAIGALGQSASFEVTIAEELDVHVNPAFRFIDRDGDLEPAIVEVTFQDQPQEIRIGAGQTFTEVLLTSGNSKLPIVVTPPHMWISTDRTETASHKFVAPLLLEIERLPDTIVRLHLGKEQRGTLALVRDSSLLLEESLFTEPSGLARVPLARFHDAAQSMGGGDLYARWANKVSLIGRIRPKKLVSNVTLDEDVLLLDRLYDNLDIEVAIQVDNAPWLQIDPIRFEPSETRAALPTDARGRGPLTLIARPFDPWEIGFAFEPGTPDTENMFQVGAEYDDERDSLEDRFVLWFAGLSPIPFGDEAIAFALNIYDSIRKRGPHEATEVRLRDIATLSLTTGRALLKALSDSRWSQQSHTRLLAEGWPATAPREHFPTDPEIWRRSPFLGLLTLSGDLTSPESRQLLADWIGMAASSILEEGNDPLAFVSAFDVNVAILAEKPRSFLDEVWRSYTAIPGQILTKDQRGIQARELFDHRSDARLNDLIRVSPSLVDHALWLLEDTVGKHATAPLHTRKTPRDWRQLPQVSFSLAFASRLAARNIPEARDLYDRSRQWYADLADCAPAFVEQDLVLAELWLTRWENS